MITNNSYRRLSVTYEIRALGNVAQELIWLRRLLSHIGYKITTSTAMSEDNQEAIEMAKNPVFHNRTEHIHIAFHHSKSGLWVPNTLVPSPIFKATSFLQRIYFFVLIGLYEAAYDLGIEWAVIKGVSSYADGNEETKKWRSFASVMAASVVHHMFKHSAVLQSWRHYKNVEYMPQAGGCTSSWDVD